MRKYIIDDLFRYTGSKDSSIINGLRRIPGFRFISAMRMTKVFSLKGLLYTPLYIISNRFLRHYSYKLGIQIPYRTEIGKGLHIGHFGCIVVNSSVRIGKNCNITHGVTIGQVNRGKKEGCPVIGDRVYLGPGCKVLGRIRVGDDAAIGANSVVVDDVPENAVVVGVPGKIISYNGSRGYVRNTV